MLEFAPYAIALYVGYRCTDIYYAIKFTFSK